MGKEAHRNRITIEGLSDIDVDTILTLLSQYSMEIAARTKVDEGQSYFKIADVQRHIACILEQKSLPDSDRVIGKVQSVLNSLYTFFGQTDGIPESVILVLTSAKSKRSYMQGIRLLEKTYPTLKIWDYAIGPGTIELLQEVLSGLIKSK